MHLTWPILSNDEMKTGSGVTVVSVSGKPVLLNPPAVGSYHTLPGNGQITSRRTQLTRLETKQPVLVTLMFNPTFSAMSGHV